MNELSFEELVKEKYDTLSPGKKRVAEYILKNLEKASYNTIIEIQNESNVSETTVIRLAYALGFSGFSDMQKTIQKQIINHNNYSWEQEVNNDNNPYSQIMEKDIQIIKQTLNTMDIENFETAVEQISQADKVLVVGYHTAYAAATWFSLTLGLLRENVKLIEYKNEYEELLGITENTVVLAISFPRYRKNTFAFLEKTKEQGAFTISVTDSKLSPIGRLADITLLTNTNRDESGYNSIAPVLSFLNLLIVGVRKKDDTTMNERLQKLEEFYQKDESIFE
ncbi:MurR/RpiR family transcriptional regulator [Salibacterium aidingense]|uniref:MurR/RpiR family transcriptional regulator n=1 Tax=Salibacterium aidingense TaxID=384933 RepID=UPI000424FAAF|nr:MurR/RpiR family transcriptional regulator [Salibacterium aidingense]